MAILRQISQQLLAASAGTPQPVESTNSFEPSTAVLVCNVLWFISLALSLTCALLATLIKQWAREFLHKTEIRPSPTQRARLFSFLYSGIKRFRLHTIVDIIPMLLHISLFMFFGGLAEFLLPLNRMLMICLHILRHHHYPRHIPRLSLQHTPLHGTVESLPPHQVRDFVLPSAH